MSSRILYVQYTNPAGYPPLERSSRLLADQGCEIRFLGHEGWSASDLAFPPQERILVERMPSPSGGWSQKLHYLRFAAWCLRETRTWKPDWVYVSDPTAAPIGLAVTTFFDIPVLYHEHDSPPEREDDSTFTRVIMSARRALARRADLCVLPNEDRLDYFVEQTGRTGPTLCVWNVPALEELPAVDTADPEPTRATDDPFYLHYQGSIGPTQLPVSILQAMTELPETVRLQVYGYEYGEPTHTERLRAETDALGLGSRVDIHGPVRHHNLVDHARRAHLGLSLMPSQTDNINMHWMVGASNKPFEYLASGLPILVTDLPAWRRMYVDPGYGRACDPTDPNDVAAAIRPFVDDPDAARRMGEAGRRRIREEWNYEAEFEPVRRRLRSGTL